MQEKIKSNRNLFRQFIAASPKIVLLFLSFLNFFAVPVIYAHLCFYNWSGQFYNALLVLVAAGCLWLNKRFGYAIAILAGCFALYDFCYTALLFLGFLPLPKGADASEITFETWWRIMKHHPEEFTHVALALAILITAAYFLLRNPERKERIFK